MEVKFNYMNKLIIKKLSGPELSSKGALEKAFKSLVSLTESDKCEFKVLDVKISNPSRQLKNGSVINVICKNENTAAEESKEENETYLTDAISKLAISDDKKQKKNIDKSMKEETKQVEGDQKNNNNSNKECTLLNVRYVVRLRGLPWSAREPEIKEFFKNDGIKEIQMVYLTDGRASGEALVEFTQIKYYQSAFLRNRQHIGHRYIEIFKSSGVDIDTTAGRAIKPPKRAILSRNIVRMRGLPYSATDEDVLAFFKQTKPSAIHLIKDDLGRPSGEGFAEFSNEVDAIAAMAKHRHHMGHRYIELFRSSPDELSRALGLISGGWGNNRSPQPKSKCLLMRGLPYSCTESDITKFYQEIDITPIRIHRKADGAEAYVEFYSIDDTDKAMTRHRSYIGKRYVELFRVTYEDMARTVGLPVYSKDQSNSSILSLASRANTPSLLLLNNIGNSETNHNSITNSLVIDANNMNIKYPGLAPTKIICHKNHNINAFKDTDSLTSPVPTSTPQPFVQFHNPLYSQPIHHHNHVYHNHQQTYVYAPSIPQQLNNKIQSKIKQIKDSAIPTKQSQKEIKSKENAKSNSVLNDNDNHPQINHNFFYNGPLQNHLNHHNNYQQILPTQPQIVYSGANPYVTNPYLTNPYY